MIPVCQPLLGKKEEAYVLDCLRSNWISSAGKYIGMFEEAFAGYCGVRYGIMTTSGTTALHLALSALGVGAGDEVIMPDFTIASTAFAALYCGAKPVFVDSEEGTWNIDPGRIEEKITKKTRVIIPVHIYGHPCEMDKIMRIAGKYKLDVVEDAAEAHGSEYKGRKAGSIGRIGCFSLYGNKVITSGEGGIVVTNDKRIAGRCRSLKNLSFIESRRFWHRETGFNYRPTNIQAAIALAQLERIEELIDRRREHARIYNKLLAGVEGLTLPVELPSVRNTYWMYGLLVDKKKFGRSREEVMGALRGKGIETRTFFIPMHGQPFLRKKRILSKGRFPVADKISKQGFYLPSGSGLKKQEISYICDCIRKIKKGS